MDYVAIDYTPVASFTPWAVLAVLVIGLAVLVLVDRLSNPRLSRRSGPVEATEARNAPSTSLLGRLAEREIIGQLSAAHLLRRRFQIG